MNLLNAPTYKLTERRQILQRVYDALVASEHCRIPTHGMYLELTAEEISNWEARQSVIQAMQEVPS